MNPGNKCGVELEELREPDLGVEGQKNHDHHR
jgi:hypothetical protein